MIFDRVKETTTTTGTGTYSLAGAAAGFRSFVSAVGDYNLCYYAITDNVDWEVGMGRVTDAGTDTLSRIEILASSNAGAAVNWGAGSKDIWVTDPAYAARGQTAEWVKREFNITKGSCVGRGARMVNQFAHVHAVTDDQGWDKAGCHQRETMVLGNKLTTSTPTPLLAGTDTTAKDGFVIPSDTAVLVKAFVVCKATGGTLHEKAWEVSGLFIRGSSLASLVGSLTKTVIATGASAGAYDVTLTPGPSNGQINVEVTGPAGTEMMWTAAVDIVHASLGVTI